MRVFHAAAVLAAALAVSAPLSTALAQKAPAPMADKAAASDPVIATVNGENILRSDLDTARAQLPEQYRSMPMNQLFQPLLNQMIRTKILSQKARTDELQKTDAYKRRLAMIGDRLLEEALLEREIGARVSEDALRARYKETVDKFPSKDEIRARHILVKTEAEAAAIIKQLEGGGDFAKLAAEKSTGPSKVRGGDLGYFGRGQMVPQFEEAAFALAKGAITKKPVQSQFGWHVIKVEDKRQSKPPSFDEARAKLFEELSQEAAETVVKELMAKAAVQRFELDGSAPRLRRIQPAR